MALFPAMLCQLAAPYIQAQKTIASQAAQKQASGAEGGVSACAPSATGSPYIPVDSWIYQAVARLNAMGYTSRVYMGMRPWTRASTIHMLEDTSAEIQDADQFGDSTLGEAQSLYDALVKELKSNSQDLCPSNKGQVKIESSYSVVRVISGNPLRDSFHLGSSIINDYGRPFATGFNNYSGASGYATAGRFLIYLRGEFQGGPSATGYSPSLSDELAAIDLTTDYFNPTCWATGTSCTPIPYNQQATIPAGPIAPFNKGRFIEAYVSTQYLNHVISFGKQDYWQGPGLGGAMSYSNNAENIYSFRINRIESINIPLLSRLTGPFRYEIMIGPLKGHVYPRNPWVHLEKVSFRPTTNLEFGFERTAIFGGEGHAPITLKSFLRSFFSLSAPSLAVKNSSADPGARFGAFDFSYRLPFVRNWLTLYSDSEVHDDVSPIDAPRRASWRPGVYLSHMPGLPKLDLRVEGVSTDPPVLANSKVGNNSGRFMYWEFVQRQGYTNAGQIFGDWIGREDKGGQAWLTYHLSGNEWIQIEVRHQKAEKDFIRGGTTFNEAGLQIVKRLKPDLELRGNFTFERYKAPIYLPGSQTVTATTFQLTWFPERKVNF
jgi:hypothetical protein